MARMKCILLAIAVVILVVPLSTGCGKHKGKVFAPAATPPDKVTGPVPADGAVDVPVGQALSWDSAGGADSYDVYFGTVESDVLGATTGSSEFKGNQASLSYDPPGDLAYDTPYYWRIDSVNGAGATAGDVWTLSTESAPDTPPVITSGPSVADVTNTTATITWTTDEVSDSVVQYGLTAAYGQTESDAADVTNHSIILTGLAAETTYHFRVGSTDPSDNGPTWSGDCTFTTKSASDTTPPYVAEWIPSKNATEVPVRTDIVVRIKAVSYTHLTLPTN